MTILAPTHSFVRGSIRTGSAWTIWTDFGGPKGLFALIAAAQAVGGLRIGAGDVPVAIGVSLSLRTPMQSTSKNDSICVTLERQFCGQGIRESRGRADPRIFNVFNCRIFGDRVSRWGIGLRALNGGYPSQSLFVRRAWQTVP